MFERRGLLYFMKYIANQDIVLVKLILKMRLYYPPLKICFLNFLQLKYNFDNIDNIYIRDIFFNNRLRNIISINVTFKTPYISWSVRGAYNACISRVGCYGQPVTNTRSSITSLHPSPLTLPPLFPSLLLFYLSFSRFLSFSSVGPFLPFFDCLGFSDVTVTILELEN